MLKDLIGHSGVKSLLAHMLETQRIPQAFVFYGEQGVGKTTFAKAFAKKLVHSNKMHHPDIRIYSLEEGQTSHTIASIRQLKEEVYLPPFEAEHKVFIIEEAHRMLPASSNALLKTLEEPSSYCKIILLTEHLSSLLPTVVSRCCKVPFSPLSREEIVEFLTQKQQVEAEEAAIIAHRACGSIARALLFKDKEERAWLDVLCELVLKFYTCSVDQAHERLAYLEEQAEKRISCSKEVIYEYVLRLIRDLNIAQGSQVQGSLDPSHLFFKDQESSLNIAAQRLKLSSREMQKLWQEGYESLASHMKLKVGLERLLMRLYV